MIPAYGGELKTPIFNSVRGLVKNKINIFSDFCESPRELREWFEKNGWETIIGFKTRNPIHRGHLEVIRRAHEMLGGGVLIHPVMGEKTGDSDPMVRMRCYKLLRTCIKRI